MMVLTWDPLHARVWIVASDVPGPTATLWRRAGRDLAAWAFVRSAYDVDTATGSLVRYDYEMPIDGQTVQYAITQGTALPSVATQRWEISPKAETPWLRDLGFPGRSTPVTVQSMTDISRPGRVGVYDVAGRADPVTVHDVRSSRRGSVILLTRDLSQASAMRDILETGAPLLLQVSESNADFEDCYMALLDASSVKIMPESLTSVSKLWTLEYVEVARPAGDVVPFAGRTFGDLLALTGRFELVRARFPTFLDVLVSDPLDIPDVTFLPVSAAVGVTADITVETEVVTVPDPAAAQAEVEVEASIEPSVVSVQHVSAVAESVATLSATVLTTTPQITGYTVATRNGSTGNLQVTLPPGSNGYLALVGVTRGTAAILSTGDSGWEQSAAIVPNSTWNRLYVWRSTSATPNTSWWINQSVDPASGFCAGIIVIGLTHMPVVDAISFINNSNNAPSVTTSKPALILRLWTANTYNVGGGYQIGFPSGSVNTRTQRAVATDGSEGNTQAVAGATQLEPGATGTGTFTVSGASHANPGVGTIALVTA